MPGTKPWPGAGRARALPSVVLIWHLKETKKYDKHLKELSKKYDKHIYLYPYIHVCMFTYDKHIYLCPYIHVCMFTYMHISIYVQKRNASY